ncbi:amino acid ABC transporter substrate-binding protein (PAAT family) [Bacillus oleivorans]|uniref:Amino acid ABC transporter substrate-binding protein (PAAT family) n=1 Tax=Bacillus oleivorans TaxID=1448271 RepID=A0A285CUT3_9BACI|nr:transporter substrate-binding domain-containing protein [Bacillus oleivorans]SNX70796.1 amino acid ABC transporter substrate-binding protein (PAAT family) [Bacillus oleivorans]
MKGFYLSIVGLLLLVVVTACGSGEATSGNGEKSALERVLESEVLRVGFEGTYRPFNYLGDDNEYTGFDVDIANELAKRLGVKTEFVATKWDSLIGGLKADKFDIIIAQMTVTEERKKSVDFTDPYVVTGSVLITREDTNDISVLEDIKGKKVGVGGGTTFEEVARSVEGANVNLYQSLNDYLQDLINGRLDVIINDQLLMSHNIKEENLPVKIVSDILNKDEIGMAVKKGNEDFVQKINEELKKMKEDGTYTEIYKKWFDSEPLIKE